MTTTQSDPGGSRPQGSHAAGSRPEHLPPWSSALVVVAHPDDESFGLGAIIHQLTSNGTDVNILCYTHGEASTLNETGADLRSARQEELRQATAALGAVGLTLLEYPDGGLAGIGAGELARHVAGMAQRHRPEGLLVFDDTGITGHPDHQAATQAAVDYGLAAGLPVLAWALPAVVADQLSQETGAHFAGQQPDQIDLCVRVDREVQRRAALLHATQVSPTAVLWRRLQLLGDCEHLRWLRPPG